MYRFLILFFLFPAIVVAEDFVFTQEGLELIDVQPNEFTEYFSIDGICKNITDERIENIFIYLIVKKEAKVLTVNRIKLGTLNAQRERRFGLDTTLKEEHFDKYELRVYRIDFGKEIEVLESQTAEPLFLVEGSFNRHYDYYYDGINERTTSFFFGEFRNDSPYPLKDVYVEIDFLDGEGNVVGRVETTRNISLLSYALIPPQGNFYFMAELNLSGTIEEYDAYASWKARIHYWAVQVDGVEIVPVSSVIQGISWGTLKAQFKGE